MQWEGREGSENVTVRRGGAGVPIVGGGLGMIVLFLLASLMGFNPGSLLTSGPDTSSITDTPEGQKLVQFVKVVLKDTEDVWDEQFKKMGRTYEHPHLVIFSGQTQSGCGFASSAVGPFYCPEDRTVYLDLSFFQELSRRFGAPGDFAEAYVIAHEVGHHVQVLLGTSDKVRRGEEAAGSRRDANRLSVRLELQADFYAGVWAHHAQEMKHILDPGDLEEALHAASAIGDDTLQRESQGHVVPDSFTHGTSSQRVAWFKLGWDTGDVGRGNTFDDRLFSTVGTR